MPRIVASVRPARYFGGLGGAGVAGLHPTLLLLARRKCVSRGLTSAAWVVAVAEAVVVAKRVSFQSWGASIYRGGRQRPGGQAAGGEFNAHERLEDEVQVWV